MIVDTVYNLYFAESVGVRPEDIETSANRYVYSFLNSDHSTLADVADLLGPNDYSWVVGIAADIHAVNPAAKVGYYGGGLCVANSHYPTYDWLADSDLLHHMDGSPVVKVPALSPAEPGSERLKVINLSSAATRGKLISGWITFLQTNGFDALLYDGWNPDIYAQYLNLNYAPGGTLEIGPAGVGPDHAAQAYWYAHNLYVYTSELTVAMRAVGLECWSNGLLVPNQDIHYDPSNPADQISGSTYTNIVQYNHGVLSETSDSTWFGGEDWTKWLTQADQVAALSGRVLYFHQPWVLRLSHPYYVFGAAWPGHDPSAYPDGNPYNEPETAQYTEAFASGAFARFYLSAFLLIHRPGYTFFGFNDNISYFGFRGPPYESHVFDGGADWDQDVGAPLGARLTDTSGGATVWYREYERAFVLVNPSQDTAGNFSVNGLYRSWDAEDGNTYVVSSDSPHVRIPPQTGLVLFKIAHVTTSPWRLPVRAHLYHVVQETDGDIVANRAVTVYDQDGVSAFGQVMYDAPTGGSIVTSPSTDSLGRLSLYAPFGERVKLSISGVAGQQNSVFTPDPEDILVENNAVVLDQYTGDATYMLTIQPTVGGAGGNKIANLLAEDGTVALRVGPHGVGSSVAVGVTLPVLVIDNDNGAPRIFGNLSDGSYANRLMMQSSVANGNSDLGVMPNGSALESSFTAWSVSTADTSSAVRMRSNFNDGAVIESLAVGSTARDITIRPNQTESLRFATNGDIRPLDADMATNASTGFMYMRSMNGTPTGGPAEMTYGLPWVLDRSASKIWVRFSGVWKSVTLS